jgi:uncharacterized tellurite resistance protein B-like protein
MKNQEFKEFLFKSAVMAMACDGEIAESEIVEIKNIAANEIYFLGYDFEGPLKNNIDNIKANGKGAINQYLQEIGTNNLNEYQEILLIEVLLRIIEADNDVQASELKFLQMAKAKLKVDEQTLIVKFPTQIDHLIDFHNYGLNQEFTDELKFEKKHR